MKVTVVVRLTTELGLRPSSNFHVLFLKRRVSACGTLIVRDDATEALFVVHNRSRSPGVCKVVAGVHALEHAHPSMVQLLVSELAL